ncbi:MAG TPA: FAD-binding oxidoreductase [Chloroflexota bacterium]|nr:FAD-binding oxidoreductase [Chloroflexota bacterium]
MPKLRSTARKLTAAAALLLASAGALVVGQKAIELSADPSGEKDCSALGLPALPAASAAPSATALATEAAALPWSQRGGTVNDASCLSRTAVYGVLQPTTVEQIQSAVTFAQENDLKLSLAGARHSMGGHAFAPNALVLDMTRFNAMSLNRDARVLTVQSGATWHDIQNYLHPLYAVKAMQSTDIFTVGGSVAVNAHGMDHQAGSVGSTVRSMRVLLPDGTIQRASPTENQELFHLVVGGYGLFGIVLDADLDVADNVIYTTGRQVIDYRTFPDLFANELADDRSLGLFYGHLSTSPGSLLQEMILYTYRQSEAPRADLPPLGEVSGTKLRRLMLNASKQGDLQMRLKWLAEKHLEPIMESCTVPRNQAQAQGEACLVSRNEPMHDSVPYLRNNLKDDTDILQEYFVPPDRLVPFVDGLREIVHANRTKLLNASVRVVHREQNVLTYAPTDMFAVVLYVNQPTTPEGNAAMAKQTRETIDLALSLNGTFFLPYQLHYTPEQLRRAYPQIDAFFAAKRRYDPQSLLTNTFYECFGPRP